MHNDAVNCLKGTVYVDDIARDCLKDKMYQGNAKTLFGKVSIYVSFEDEEDKRTERIHQDLEIFGMLLHNSSSAGIKTHLRFS